MMSLNSLNQAWESQPKAFTRLYKIGPFTISFSSTNAPLGEMLTRAFEHLPKGSSPPNLSIRLWADHKLPTLDWTSILSNGYRGYATPPTYWHYFETLGALSAIDVSENIAYYAIRNLDTLPWWVYGSPLQVILHVWLREKGMQLTHSASIGNKKKALLLTGKGGSGKSVAVLACLKEGLSMLGEDYVLLSQDRVYSIYQTAKWKPHTRVLFPSYEKYISNPDKADSEKALIYYKDLFASQIELSSPIKAIVSLKIGKSLNLQKSNYETVLQSLLLTTIYQLPHPAADTTSILENCIKPLDHYHLTLGPDLSANTAILKGLLS